MPKPKLYVVEGKNDAKRLHEMDKTLEVFITGGMHFSQKEITYLKACAPKYDIILLLDPDGAGERIRKRLMQELPSAGNIFVPLEAARGNRKIGIEHVDLEELRTLLGTPAKYDVSRETWTLKDLYNYGLAGTNEAKLKRREIADNHQIPYANAKTFVKILNRYDVSKKAVFTRETDEI
jgi:ribonuclease M5